MATAQDECHTGCAKLGAEPVRFLNPPRRMPCISGPYLAAWP